MPVIPAIGEVEAGEFFSSRAARTMIVAKILSQKK
jgi:hypothetical protein